MNGNDNIQTLLVDIDGVACAHAKSICDWVNATYGTDFQDADVKSWDHNFGKVTFPEAVNICYPNKNFILNMEVTPGFHAFIGNMEKIMSIKFATSRDKYCHEATMEWVKTKLGNYEIAFVKAKADIPFDYLIDDYHRECIEAASKGKAVFMISRPWNENPRIRQEVRQYPNIQTAFSFEDIEASIKNKRRITV